MWGGEQFTVACLILPARARLRVATHSLDQRLHANIRIRLLALHPAATRSEGCGNHPVSYEYFLEAAPFSCWTALSFVGRRGLASAVEPEAALKVSGSRPN
jgi:hypothetical protein